MTQSHKPGDPNPAPTYAPGDVVHLASGGPGMTVCSFDPGAASVHCVWFGDSPSDGTLHNGDFDAAVLQESQNQRPNPAPGPGPTPPAPGA